MKVYTGGKWENINKQNNALENNVHYIVLEIADISIE